MIQICDEEKAQTLANHFQSALTCESPPPPEAVLQSRTCNDFEISKKDKSLWPDDILLILWKELAEEIS